MIRNIVILLFAFARICCAEDARVGAVFKEGSGIYFSEESRVAVGVEMAAVEDAALSGEFDITAQIYREASEPSQNAGEKSGFAYAGAMMDSAAATRLEPQTAVRLVDTAATGRVLRIDRTMQPATDLVEILLEIPDPRHARRVGDFIRCRVTESESRDVSAIPETAVLVTAFGEFVYVKNGDALLRTAVKTGVRQNGRVEIIEGLYSGDEIAVASVESLYLIELRATKGGGHCH